MLRRQGPAGGESCTAVPGHAMKAHRGSAEVPLLAFLTSPPDEGKGPASGPGRFTPREYKHWYKNHCHPRISIHHEVS
jgi:hypothetical protein